jgi:hypothetical protein
MSGAAAAALNGSAAGLTFSGLSPSPSDDQPSPSPSPSPEQLLGEGSPSPLDDLTDRSPSDSDELPDELTDHDDESAPTGSRSGSRAARRAVEQAQQAAARKAVRMGATMLHARLARDEAAQAAGVFLMDDDTAAGIADPLARIAARHMPADNALANPDVTDGISAMMGVADYVRLVVEQQQKAAEYRVGLAPESVDAVDL